MLNVAFYVEVVETEVPVFCKKVEPTKKFNHLIMELTKSRQVYIYIYLSSGGGGVSRIVVRTAFMKQKQNQESVLNIGQSIYEERELSFIPFLNWFQSASSPILLSTLLSFARLPPFLISPAAREKFQFMMVK